MDLRKLFGIRWRKKKICLIFGHKQFSGSDICSIQISVLRTNEIRIGTPKSKEIPKPNKPKLEPILTKTLAPKVPKFLKFLKKNQNFQTFEILGLKFWQFLVQFWCLWVCFGLGFGCSNPTQICLNLTKRKTPARCVVIVCFAYETANNILSCRKRWICVQVRSINPFDRNSLDRFFINLIWLNLNRYSLILTR